MRTHDVVAVASMAVLVFSTAATAAGFALEHQSVSNLGYGFAGGAASAEDASTIYWNPAGMARLPRREAVIGVNALYVSARFTDGGSTSPAGPLFPITGGNGGNPVGLNWVPNLYYATRVAPELAVGIGINAPFGLKTKYPADWIGRYQAIDSVVKSVNFNPALAWTLGNGISFGAGLNLQYFDAMLSNAIDFGAACFAALGPAACTSAGITPQSKDAIAKVSGDSWSLGWNAGALVGITAATRVGIAYRSSIKHQIKGRASFENPALPEAFRPLTAGAQDTGARSTIHTPDLLSVGSYAELSARWSFLADVTWTGWSRFKELRVHFDNGSPDAVTAENWRNTVRLSLGTGYRVDERWTLRTGIGYENSAIRDEFRTPRIPDSAHTLLGLGFNHKISKAGSLDGGYMHIFVKDAPVKLSTGTAGTLAGNYKVRGDVLSLQYNHHF